MWRNYQSLKGKLPLFDSGQCVSYSEASYREYFSFYGFDRLSGLHQRYHFGLIDSEIPFACHWWRQRESRRTVVVVHGLFDHVGLYLPLIEDLLKQGMDVLAIDLPDHGLSSAEYGSLKSFLPYSQAVSTLLCSPQVPLATPITLIGQSTGGAVLFDYLNTYSANKYIDQLILLAPLLRVPGWLGVKLSYALLHRWVKRVPRSYQSSSHDEKFCDFLRDSDPMQSDFVSVAWVGAMLAWEKRFDQFRGISLPTLLIQGSADTTVAFEHNIPRYKAKITDLQFRMVDGARHHLVGESDPWRSEVFTHIRAFIAAE